MVKSIEVPIVPKMVGGDALANIVLTLERIADRLERPKTTGEIRYENAVLAVLTRIADALDAIHGTLAAAVLPEPQGEVSDDPE